MRCCCCMHARIRVCSHAHVTRRTWQPVQWLAALSGVHSGGSSSRMSRCVDDGADGGSDEPLLRLPPRCWRPPGRYCCAPAMPPSPDSSAPSGPWLRSLAVTSAAYACAVSWADGNASHPSAAVCCGVTCDRRQAPLALGRSGGAHACIHSCWRARRRRRSVVPHPVVQHHAAAGCCRHQLLQLVVHHQLQGRVKRRAAERAEGLAPLHITKAVEAAVVACSSGAGRWRAAAGGRGCQRVCSSTLAWYLCPASWAAQHQLGAALSTASQLRRGPQPAPSQAATFEDCYCIY